MKKAVNRKVLKYGGLALGLVMWEIIGIAMSDVIPPLHVVIKALITLLKQGQLLAGLGTSMLLLSAGYLLAVIIGVLLGVGMGRYQWADEMLGVFVDAAMAVPMVSFVPVLVILLGTGNLTQVAVVVLFSVFPIIVNTYTGIKGVKNSLLEMSYAFGAVERQIVMKILFPAALPGMITGMKLGMSRAIKGMINAQMLIAVVGLGQMMTYYGDSFQMDFLFAIILVIVIVTIIVNELMRNLDKLVIHWQQHA